MSTGTNAQNKDASFNNLTVNSNLVIQKYMQANNVNISVLTIDKDLVTNGDVKINGALEIEGPIISAQGFEGDANITGNLTVAGTTELNGVSTTIAGTATIGGATTIGGPLTLTSGPGNTLTLDTITKNGTTMSWPSADGLIGAVLTTNGAGEMTFVVPPAPGTGNVFAPVAFSTNHALIRVNNATGSLNVEDSNVTLSNTNNISGVNTLTANQVTAPLLNGNATSATNFNGFLAGDVTGPQSATTVALVGGSSAASVNAAAVAVAAATNSNVPGALVRRDGAGNFSAATITAPNLIGNASSATFATVAGSAVTCTNFTNALVGDVTGTQAATSVALVGGQSASNVATATTSALAATNNNISNTIVKRDALGNFNGNQITAVDFLGNASTATFATTAGSSGTFSGSFNGDVTGSQSTTVVANVPALATFPGGQTGTSVAAGAQLANTSTNTNTANAIVRRDGSGNFIVNQITGLASPNAFVGNVLGNLNGNAATATTAASSVLFTGPLVGDVTGLQGTTAVATVGGSSAADIAAATTVTMAATSSATPGTVVRRDGSGNFSANAISASTAAIGTVTGSLIGNASSATTSATANNFSGLLNGNVVGTQNATVVASVGGAMAADIGTATALANAATNNNTASTIVKRDASGNFSAGDIAVNSSSATVSFSAPRITILGPVTLATDATTKDYVDTTFATGALVPHPPAQALANSNNSLNGFQIIDSVSLTTGSRVLAVGQLSQKDNGLWQVAGEFDPWVRPADFPPAPNVAGAAYVLIDKPIIDNLWGGSSWLCSTPTAGVDVNPIVFVQFGVANNTSAANVGASGVGVFANKISNTLNFKKINSINAPYLTVADGTTTVDLSTNATSLSTPTTLVARDGSGTFAGSLTGAASLNVLKTGDSMTGALALRQQNGLVLENAAADNKTITLRAPSIIPTSYTLDLPTVAPLANQFLQALSTTTTRWVSFGGPGNPLIAPRNIYVSKTGSDISGDGTQIAPYLTIRQALSIAIGLASLLTPIVIDVGAGVYIEDNSSGALPWPSAGITLCGSSLTGSRIVPNTLSNNLFFITTPFYEICNISIDSGSNGGSTAAAIATSLSTPGQIGIHTVLIQRFQTALSITSSSMIGAPTVILAEFQAIGNGTAVAANDIRLIVENCLLLGPFGTASPLHTGLVVSGSSSLVLLSASSFRLFQSAIQISNGALLRQVGVTIEASIGGVSVSLGGRGVVVGSSWITNSNLSINAFVTDASSSLEITGCSFNGGTGGSLGTGLQCISGGTMNIASSTIYNMDSAIVCGTTGDTNTTSIRSQGVSIRFCNTDALHTEVQPCTLSAVFWTRANCQLTIPPM